MLSRMESGRAYDLFPFISAPVKCGFRKALVMSMISRAVIFEIIIFFMFGSALVCLFRDETCLGKVWLIGGMT